MPRRSMLLAFVALSGLHALAQNLPNVVVHSATNETINIAWPYTNSGFALLESTN